MTTVAVIGASPDRNKFGNKAVRAFRDAGYSVVPITPHHTAIEGLTAYASVLDYPGALAEATMYVQPAVGLTLLDDLAAKGVGHVWFNPGADGQGIIAAARARGLNVTRGCSIIGIGKTPWDY